MAYHEVTSNADRRYENVSILLVLFQALLFSATFRKRVERLARDILTDPIRVVQGEVGEVRFGNSKFVFKLFQEFI